MALDSLAQDARYGLRQLRRTPLFASATVLTLALTIGATTALFAIANAVVFRPLPYRESDRIVTLTIEQAGRDIGVFDEPTAELAMRAGMRTFESVAACRTTGANLAGGAQPERVEGAVVGAGFFDVVGVRPAVGRTFAPDELQRGGPAAIVLSHALWDRAFGRSPDVVNRAVRLDDQSYAVVGVMPPGFRYPSRSEFWLPWSPRGTGRALYFTSFIGGLRPGETTAAARDELLALRRGHERDLPQRALETSIRIVPLHEALRGKFRRPFVLLLAIVGCVLLIACANVANLLMARTSVRRRELAVRVALGAQRGRLVRQLLIESLLLASLGAVPGLALAYAGMQAFTVFGPAALAQLPGIAIDGTVLLFTLVVTIGTGLLFGIAPAFAAGRADPQSWLKGSAASADRADRQRARRLLVVLELAATVVLTIGAALLAKSYVRYTATHRGFHADRVLTASVPLPRPRYADPAVRRAFSDGVLDRLRRSPAILSATHSDTMLGSMTMTIRLPAALTSTGRSSDDESFAVSFVGSDYFRTFGIPLLAGSDCPMQPDRPAAILSEPLAQLMYPGRSPLGETIQLSGQGLYTIVGVAANVRALAANTNGLPKVYACAGRTEAPLWGTIAIRPRDDIDPLALVATLREAVQAVDPSQPLAEIRTVREIVSEAVTSRWFDGALIASFAALAIVLSVFGLYALVAYLVAQRTQEFGVRIALGARPSDVIKLVLGEGGGLIAAGLILGVAAALPLVRFLKSLLFEVEPLDATAFAATALLLTVVATAATCLPALRASRVDPVRVIRVE